MRNPAIRTTKPTPSLTHGSLGKCSNDSPLFGIFSVSSFSLSGWLATWKMLKRGKDENARGDPGFLCWAAKSLDYAEHQAPEILRSYMGPGGAVMLLLFEGFVWSQVVRLKDGN